MCGIAGFIDAGQGSRENGWRDEIDRMTAMLHHRGPDGSGTWHEPENGLALGHRRLAILDLSAAGHQPMISASGRYVLCFNGEVYNFRTLREQLLAKGAVFRGESDTEVLLEAIATWGVSRALVEIQGMFAFAVWDRLERRLTLARDRMGEKPLYYGWAGSAFLFGSELKALRAHSAWNGTVDRDALTLYLRHNYVPAPRSIYAGICKLLPGCTVEFQHFIPGNLPEPRAYWSIGCPAEGEAISPASDAEAVNELERLLGAAVEKQMVADVPLGAFLSGGIDSSTVVALMQAVSNRPVRTFTLGVHDAALDEAPAARAVAAHLRTDHTELYARPEDALDVIPHLSRIYDEPFADSSQIPTFLISQLARKSVTVSLSGDGGDELFGGYERYVRGPRLQRRIGWIPMNARRKIGRLLQSRPVAAGLDLFARRDGGLAADRAARLAELMTEPSLLGVHRALLSNWTHPASVVRSGNEPSTPFTAAAGRSFKASLAERMLLTDAATYLPDDLLVKVDRAAMAVSLETRVPLLDRGVVEFAMRLPWHMKIRAAERKWILRQVLYRHVPRTLVDRPKKGFGVPIGVWLRGPLKSWADRLLNRDRIDAEGYFDSAPIATRWKQHQSGRHDWSYPLWTILMFQAWLEREGAHRAEIAFV